MINKIQLHLVLISVIFPLLASGQEGSPNTTDRLIEGGNLFVEILKIVQKSEGENAETSTSKQSDCATKKFTNICFINKSKERINVKLTHKNEEKNHELIIGANGKECCYRIAPGVYSYSLTRSDDPEKKPFRKGEMLLEVCNDVEVKIK
jgi:hypothetical protein